MIKKRNTLKYNWSDKHKEYMRKTQNAAINIAEGSIRSGKTTDNIFCFAHDLKKSKDKLHLATASTQPAAKVIIGDCDGYGLEHIFRGQCKWGKYKGNDCLRIKGPDTNFNEKIVLFCGGAKSDSYKKFRGYSIGLWIATEINLHHKNTIEEALKRQIKAHIKHLYWDLNPENPNDTIYTEYIDKWKKMDDEGILVGGYNYESFNIFDNINIPEKNLKEVLSRYVVGTVYYIRDILGKRAVAEGLIYQQFADNLNAFVIDELTDNLIYITIGIDYGASRSRTSFKATGFSYGFNTVYSIDEEDIKGVNTPEQVYRAFELFYLRVVSTYGAVHKVYADYGALGQVLTQGLRNYIASRGLPVIIDDCSKGTILDRINFTNQIMALGRYKILRKCKNLILALQTAVWDEKKIDERLDDGTTDIDSLDAFEYSVFPQINKIMR